MRVYLFLAALLALPACNDFGAGVGISSGGGVSVGASGRSSNGTRGAISFPVN
ncbi:hypothetical protein [Roseobacter sp. HKCCA0434]|uniref:hypothetical protein n=1 Tax=Roseobacter sp. HKCCA0434 TaxID=3079297 RepID=UPI002905F14A|nr:hypothetical protein [Roseobacter sp. HKCCA0434]